MQAQAESYKAEDIEDYEYVACSLTDCCKVCKALDGKTFKVKDMEPGENAPPMHPNCHCATAPYLDREEFDEWLDGYSEHGLTFEEWKDTKNSRKLEIRSPGSTASFQKSLKSILNGTGGLDKRRTSIANKLPETGSYCRLERGSISNRDMAYISASMRNELALFRSKSEDLLLRGDTRSCNPSDEIANEILSGKYEWVSHTHVDGTLMASLADRNTLVSLKQKKSLIISAITGETQSFTQSQFDDMYS